MSRAGGIVGVRANTLLWAAGCQDVLDPQPPHTARDHFVEAPLSERFQEGLEDGATSQLFDPLSFC